MAARAAFSLGVAVDIGVAKLADMGQCTSGLASNLIPFTACQRSGEGVVRRNGCPNGCFWRIRFFSVPLKFALKESENLEGHRINGLSKNTLLDNRFSARRLLRSFGGPPTFNHLSNGIFMRTSLKHYKARCTPRCTPVKRDRLSPCCKRWGDNRNRQKSD